MNQTIAECEQFPTDADDNACRSHATPAWLRGDPRQWENGTLDRAMLRDAAMELRRHSLFDDTARYFAASMLEAFESSHPLNRLLRGETSLGFVAFILALHTTRDPCDPMSGASYSRLVELFGVIGVGSQTVIKAMLGLARLRGYIRYCPSADKRLRILEPTEGLIETLRVWFRAYLKATERIAPLPLPAIRLAQTPGLLEWHFTYSVQAYIHDRFVLSEDFPAVRAFMQRNHGYLVLMAIISGLHRCGEGRPWTSLPSGDLAKRLKLSRGTVRNIQAMAQQQGWLSCIGRGGHEVELDPEFAEICLQWIATELVWSAGLTGIAHATLAGQPA